MPEINFKNDLTIDRYNLDQVCVDHAELVANWGLQWAEAVRIKDYLEDNLTVIRSKCDQEIREEPSKFGWQKADKAPTEAFINSAIMAHSAYIEANKELSDAKHEVNILIVAKNSFEHRDRRISDLVKLYGNNYFSSNKQLGAGYENLREEALEKAQNEGLEKNTRLVRRRTT
jgi:hypothetical protein